MPEKSYCRTMPGWALLTFLVNSTAEESRPFSAFMGQGSGAVYESELLLAQKWVKDGVRFGHVIVL